MKSILGLLIALFLPAQALAVSLPVAGQDLTPQNYVVNPGFENGGYGWTTTFTSGGVSSSAKAEGNMGYSGDSNSAGQTLLSKAVTIPAGLFGRNGAISCLVKTPSGASSYTITAYDGTNNIGAAVPITSSTTFTKTITNFIFPSTGTIQVKITSVAANEPGIFIDSCYVGEAMNVMQVSQSQAYSDITWLFNAANGTWGVTSVSMAPFSVNASAPTPTVNGNCTAPSTKLPAITCNNLSPGKYMIVATGEMYTQTTNGDGAVGISDGTNVLGEAGMTTPNVGTSIVSTAGTVVGFVTYTSTQSAITFVMVGGGGNGTGVISIDNRYHSLRMAVYKYPATNEIAMRPELTNWRVDASIAGANPSLGTASVASYSGVENGSLTLTNNTGASVLTAQIPCSTTNPPTGTTCAAGNESVGVSFNLPVATDVRACAAFSHSVGTSASGTIGDSFELVETPSNAQTISQEGKDRISDFFGTQNTNIDWPFKVCGTFTFTSSGQKTLRLFYEQLVTGTITQSSVNADAAASLGQRDIHWEVYPLGQNVPNPILVGSVTSNSSGQERVERAVVASTANCAASPCTITSQSGAWLSSVTRTSTGLYVANFAAGMFTAPPACTANGSRIGTGPVIVRVNTSPTTSSWTFDTFDGSGVVQDAGNIQIQCVGPR